jgi:hypothetical protein
MVTNAAITFGPNTLRITAQAMSAAVIFGTVVQRSAIIIGNGDDVPLCVAHACQLSLQLGSRAPINEAKTL